MLQKLRKFSSIVSQKSHDRVFMFRLLATVLAIDFVAIMALTSLNPLRLLNPFEFLAQEASDRRPVLSLYFLKAFQLDEGQNETELLETKQRVYQVHGSEPKPADIIENARYILAQLESGSEDLRARRALKGKISALDFWLMDSSLVVKTNNTVWNAMQLTERDFARQTIEKSLLANLPIKQVIFDFGILTPK